MLQPKRVKYRRAFRGRRAGKASRGSTIEFGEYALKALASCWLTARQIEAARRAIAHYTRRSGRIWIRVFPDKPVTKKPAETRMGSGKGAVDHYVSVVKPGTIMFEMGGVEKEIAIEAMRRAAAKLPIETKFISLEE
ncbi:MAG: 50S ribosomal protein L16 [Candidatus Woykebacteria bacterium GWB1_45_5]|uniref:Large ribosomal subunit protein uL16 n=2 Tax=Candidatus Woykeibacteriota TaxID=1817899 RepID=A0A1G1W3E9_9BACT|nr:MAG: 50S ribosomal protein L16 [Candidatus Woykebacteria bacterium GWA1_44_8]OGY23326.1 MAG: 50S ribosomal protein L16 [Candidatus Woykebacteria bacterium GWB1_45_5]